MLNAPRRYTVERALGQSAFGTVYAASRPGGLAAARWLPTQHDPGGPLPPCPVAFVHQSKL